MGKEALEQYQQKLENYIARLDPDIRTEQKNYETRLKMCGKCKNLINGMCRVCGCYVELRAAIKGQSCPDTYKRW